MNIRSMAACITGAIVVSATWAMPSIAEDIILPNEVATTHWKTDYQNEFADLLRERTDGELNVQVYPSGQLYNEQDALAALGTGAVHMVWPVAVRVESISPETGVINLPFAISDEQMADACFAQGLTSILSSYLEPRGLGIIGLLRTADLFFIFRDHEVTEMEDLDGLKIRVTGGRIFLDTMERLGISPVSMAASEMSTALSQGAIDGVFSSPAGWAEMIGMTGRYAWYVPGFQLSTYAVVVDNVWFNNLTPEHQDIITSTMDEISQRQWVDAKAADELLIEEMEEQGAVFHVADEGEIERWRELANESNASFNERYAETVSRIDELEASCGPEE